MWATAEESRADLLALYRRTSGHGDGSVRALGLDATATVPWWPPDRQRTTVGYVVARVQAAADAHR